MRNMMLLLFLLTMTQCTQCLAAVETETTYNSDHSDHLLNSQKWHYNEMIAFIAIVMIILTIVYRIISPWLSIVTVALLRMRRWH